MSLVISIGSLVAVGRGTGFLAFLVVPAGGSTVEVAANRSSAASGFDPASPSPRGSASNCLLKVCCVDEVMSLVKAAIVPSDWLDRALRVFRDGGRRPP